MPSCDWPTVCLHESRQTCDIGSTQLICAVTRRNTLTLQLTLKQMHDQQISNQRRTHTVHFLCCFAVNIASNIGTCAYLSSAIFCRHCHDVRSDVWHGSKISSADFLRKLNHAHKSWPALSIVWLLLNSVCLLYVFCSTAVRSRIDSSPQVIKCSSTKHCYNNNDAELGYSGPSLPINRCDSNHRLPNCGLYPEQMYHTMAAYEYCYYWYV